MAYQYLFFDLDGTLTDPGLGITNGVMYALKKFGIETADRTRLYPFIGPPLIESFEKFYGFSKEQAREAAAYYRDYYGEKGKFENTLIEGIPDMLKRLCAQGKTLFLATSKGEDFAREIMDYFQLTPYFTKITGAFLDGGFESKAQIIGRIIDSCEEFDRSLAVMIGDREHDVLAAQEQRIASIGVLFGYGSREELLEAGADEVAETVAELERKLMKNEVND